MPTVPEGVKVHRRGSCVPCAVAMLPELKHGRDFIVEGLIRLGADPREHEHTWMVIAGQVFDPSILQFRRFRAYAEGVNRIEVRVWSVAEYWTWWRIAASPWWDNRLRVFGVRRIPR